MRIKDGVDYGVELVTVMAKGCDAEDEDLAYSDDAGRRFQSKPATDSDACRPPGEGRETGLGDYGFGVVRSVKSGALRLRSDSPCSAIR